MFTDDAGLPEAGQTKPGEPSLTAQIAWGGTGFLLGVIVWHFIGFWSFVSTVVYRGPGPGTAVAGMPASASRPAVTAAAAKRGENVLGSAPAQPSAAASASDCSVLALDRASGTTTLAGCADDMPPLQVVLSSPRGDRRTTIEARPSDRGLIIDARAGFVSPDAPIGDMTIDSRHGPRLGQRAVQLD